jgi:hypothetical protein
VRESNLPADISVFVRHRFDCTLFSGPKQSIVEFKKRIQQKKYEAVETDHCVADVFGIIRNSGYASKLENEFVKVFIGEIGVAPKGDNRRSFGPNILFSSRPPPYQKNRAIKAREV